jgi:hypothetical protein
MKGTEDIATHGAVPGITPGEVTQGRVGGMMVICCLGTSQMAFHGGCDGCTCDACLAIGRTLRLISRVR